jgi:putative transposase
LVEGSGNGYLKTVCDYVHLNPVRAGLLKPGQSLLEFPWSSYPQYLRPPGRRARWIRVDRLLGEMAIAADSPAGRNEFARRMEANRRQELAEEYRKIRRGWCYGEDAFRRELLLQASHQMGENHFGRERQETEEDKAQRLVREGLENAGWTEKDLAANAKADPVKMILGRRLRQETTMTMKWVAQRLQMGSWKYLNRRLYEGRTR